MKAILSDKLLRAIVAKGKPHAPVWDRRVTGLVARVGKHGGITFSAVARQRKGSRVPIRLSIGRYPLVSLAEARTRALTLLRDLADGVDPRIQRAEQARAAAARQAGQFEAVAEAFIRHHHLAGKDAAGAIALRIRRDLVGQWGGRPIADIRPADVLAMVEVGVARNHPEAARQNFVYAKRLFRWAVVRGLLEHAPTDYLNVTDLVGPKRPRQRLLNESELALIWRTAATSPYPGGPFISLLLLLGVRRSELTQAVWSEFDLDRALWVIPPERMKSDEAHAVPLSPQAVAILSTSLPRFAGCDYVFTPAGHGAWPLGSLGLFKKRFDQRVADLNSGEPIDPWTFHDCRRAFRTGLSTLGIAPHVAELCLAHRQPGLARVYDLHRFEPEKRYALNAWAARLLNIVELPQDKVVPLRSVAAS